MRVVLRALLGVGCSLFVGLGAEEARAANSLKVEGFDLLGSVGLGFSSAEPSDGRYLSADEKNSYILLGVKGGYTWPSGLRLGVDAQCGFNVLICATLTAGPSVGYDLVFSSFRFRGALDAGVWFAYGPAKPYAAPELAFIWQHGGFELGVGPRYVFAPIGSFQLLLVTGGRF
jgi:hypothetical protein